VLLDLLDDVFLLHAALETAQRVLQGFAFLNTYFGHSNITALSVSESISCCVQTRRTLPDVRLA
jgi:hypothetical protein